jgi:hypothetical protein
LLREIYLTKVGKKLLVWYLKLKQKSSIENYSKKIWSLSDETKAKVVYRELLKEDLVVIRLVPEGGMPEYQTGQFLTIGLPIPAEKKVVRRAYSIASRLF